MAEKRSISAAKVGEHGLKKHDIKAVSYTHLRMPDPFAERL